MRGSVFSLLILCALTGCGGNEESQFRPGNIAGKPIYYPRAEQQNWEVIDYDRVTRPSSKK